MSTQPDQPTTEDQKKRMQKAPSKEQMENKGQRKFFSALNMLQEQIPDSDISFNIPWEQELVVERNELTYRIKQVYDHKDNDLTHRYIVGVDFGNGHVYPKVENGYRSLSEATTLLTEIILADHRQKDLTAWNKQRHHYTVRITPSG